MKTIAAFLIILTASCHTSSYNKSNINSSTQNTAINTAANTSSLQGKWNLIPAMPSDTAAGRIPFLNFNTIEMKVSGNTGCNGFGGTYKSSPNSLVFNNDFISTKCFARA